MIFSDLTKSSTSSYLWKCPGFRIVKKAPLWQFIYLYLLSCPLVAIWPFWRFHLIPISSWNIFSKIYTIPQPISITTLQGIMLSNKRIITPADLPHSHWYWYIPVPINLCVSLVTHPCNHSIFNYGDARLVAYFVEIPRPERKAEAMNIKQSEGQPEL